MGEWEASVGASDQWYTPAYIFDALGETFDMDVAHPGTFDFCRVPARSFITRDSLSQPWAGFVWGNFPFGKRGALDQWLGKFFDHGNGIALTPDRTSAPWFQRAWVRAHLTLFMPKVRFIRPDGTTGDSPANGTCLWAAGDRAACALERGAAAGLGILAQPRRLAA